MNKIKKHIPELRFPEFEKEGEWEKKKIGEIATFHKGKGLPKMEIVQDGSNLCLHYGELFTDYAEVIDCIISHTNKEEGFTSKANDVLMPTSDVTPTGLATASCIKIDNVILGGDILVIRTDSSEIDGEFLSRFINSKKRNILRLVTGTTVYHLYPSTFDKFKLVYPKFKEQQKIAACFSSLDRLLTLEKEKLHALKDHKKGLLQKLFPEKGKTLPEVRFSEFEGDGAWKKKKMKKIYDFHVTNSFPRNKLNDYKGSVKNIHYGDIHTKYSVLFDIQKENVPFMNPNISSNKIKEDSYCQEGDLVIADASENIKDIGKTIEIVNLNDEKLVSGLHTILARQKKTKMTIGFGGYLFSTNQIKSQIRKEAQGAKVLGISMNRISNIDICYTKTEKEQSLIVSCFSNLDQLIENQSKKTTQLEAHKKGLMQQLFPKA